MKYDIDFDGNQKSSIFEKHENEDGLGPNLTKGLPQGGLATRGPCHKSHAICKGLAKSLYCKLTRSKSNI